jgi:hypothetical protein
MNGNDNTYDRATARRELAEAERQAQYWNNRREGLRRMVEAFDQLASVNGEAAHVPPGRTQQRSGGGDSFKSGILEIIRQNDSRRGVPLAQIIEEAKANGLTTDATTFEKGVLYAISGLKVKKQVRSVRKGRYRVMTPSA